MPIYYLSLEERATCPRTCFHWRDCYGNKMRLAKRYVDGQDLRKAIARQLLDLSLRHPGGFVVRLHNLGDFQSIDYALWWLALLDQFPLMRIFGYTAHELGTPIGDLLWSASEHRWDRFAMRFSAGTPPERGALHDQGIVCPNITGKTQCCGTCGLCWQTKRNIAFPSH